MVSNIGNLEKQLTEWKKWLLRKLKLYFYGFSSNRLLKYKLNLRWISFWKENKRKYQQNC
jgi:hypothetical protein